MSEKERAATREIIRDWREAGIVQDTNSPSNPVSLVERKNYEYRLHADFRRLNKQTERIHFPGPDVDDHSMSIGHNKLFISLDLANGYMQIPIHKNSRHLTAIITQDGTVGLTRMIFDLADSPAQFQKLMYCY